MLYEWQIQARKLNTVDSSESSRIYKHINIPSLFTNSSELLKPVHLRLILLLASLIAEDWLSEKLLGNFSAESRRGLFMEFCTLAQPPS